MLSFESVCAESTLIFLTATPFPVYYRFLYSRECQVQDWPLHKLMCNPDRIIVNQDGSTERVADMLARKDGGAAENTSDAGASPVPKYVSLMEMSHEDVCKSTIERLQLQTNPFVIDQWKKAGQKGFLFVQTESTLDDFRYLAGVKNGERMDRGFVCYYMTYREFTKYVDYRLFATPQSHSMFTVMYTIRDSWCYFSYMSYIITLGMSSRSTPTLIFARVRSSLN